jgi:hypothetical protein
MAERSDSIVSLLPERRKGERSMDKEFREWLSWYRSTQEWRALPPEHMLLLQMMGVRALQESASFNFEKKVKEKWERFLSRQTAPEVGSEEAV